MKYLLVIPAISYKRLHIQWTPGTLPLAPRTRLVSAVQIDPLSFEITTFENHKGNRKQPLCWDIGVFMHALCA